MMPNMIEGYLLRFGSPDDRDLDGEYFSSNTEFNLDNLNGKTIMIRAVNSDVILESIGSFHNQNLDDKGIFLTGHLNFGSIDKKQFDYLQEMIDRNIMFFAPAGKFDIDENGVITKADIHYALITSTPTDPNATPVRIVEDEEK